MLQIDFDLRHFESVEIVPIADCHCGNSLFQDHILKQTIDYVLEEPDDPKMARICLLNGDLTESVTRNSIGNIFEQTMTPSVQVATMINYLKPLTETSEKYPQGKILSYCAGNHDSGRYKDTGISAAESIAVGLSLEDRFSVDGCYSFIELNRIHKKNEKMVCTIYNTHLTGSAGTVGGKANRVLKAGVNGGIIADIIVGSHVHQPITFKEDIILPCRNAKNSLIQKTITYLVTGAMLSYGDYAQRNGMKPSSLVMPRIYIRQGQKQGLTGKERFYYTEVLL